MQLSDFDYNLPKELIAQYPLKERDQAQLMVLKRNEQSFEHKIFRDVTDYFQKGDLLVLNNTKVLPSRIFGLRLSGGRIEILLLNHKGGLVFDALIKPHRLKIGEKIKFKDSGIYAELTARNEITFFAEDINEIYKLGVMPLPPYIKREPTKEDEAYYQTVYANAAGSVAAPTAGLHFTDELICKIRSLGINITYITLHIGYPTFKPLKCEDVTKHTMGPEYFEIPDDTIEMINNTRLKGKRIFSTGTTALRALETLAQGIKKGHTDLFIYPGYEFKIVDCLLTNFHLPRTTLFILASAFCGKEFINAAYKEAIEKKYRFYSYGDAMLIL